LSEVGELLIFSLFKDGILRQYDFETELYWAPQHSFPSLFRGGATRKSGRNSCRQTVGLHVVVGRRIKTCWSTEFHLGLTGVPLVIHQH